jgi:hypothetical protein
MADVHYTPVSYWIQPKVWLSAFPENFFTLLKHFPRHMKSTLREGNFQEKNTGDVGADEIFN